MKYQCEDDPCVFFSNTHYGRGYRPTPEESRDRVLASFREAVKYRDEHHPTFRVFATIDEDFAFEVRESSEHVENNDSGYVFGPMDGGTEAEVLRTWWFNYGFVEEEEEYKEVRPEAHLEFRRLFCVSDEEAVAHVKFVLGE